MKYKIEITEILQKTIEIEASSKDEAYLSVKDKYNKENFVLTDVDYVTTEFELLGE